MKQLMTTVLAVMLFIAPVAQADNHGKDHKHAMKEMLEKFPEEKAELVKSFFKEMRAEHKASKESHKANRDQMKTLLTAEGFDSSAFVSHAEKLASHHSAEKVVKAKKLAALASQLNQQEREWLAKMMPKKGKKKGKRKGQNRE